MCQRIWKDDRFCLFCDKNKLVALYILTGSQTNAIGIFNFSAILAAEDLNFKPSLFKKCLKEVLSDLNWEYDSIKRVLYIPTWWRYNAPQNPNILINNLKQLNELPNTTLIDKFISNNEYIPETLKATFKQTLGECSTHITGAGTGTGTGELNKPPSPLIEFQESVIKKWNTIAEKHGLPQVDRITAKRKTHLNARFKSSYWMANWQGALVNIPACPFLLGKNDRGWKANFNWFIRSDDQVVEIVEGKYNNNQEEEPKEKIIPYTEKVRLGLIKD